MSASVSLCPCFCSISDTSATGSVFCFLNQPSSVPCAMLLTRTVNSGRHELRGNKAASARGGIALILRRV